MGNIMMTQDNLDITWQDFSGHVSNIINELGKNERFTDVTLVSVDLIEFKAHKVILSGSSQLLSDILEKDANQPIYLQGIKSSGLRLILDFMYFGKITIPKDQFYEFLSDTEFLKVKGINLFGGINCGKVYRIKSQASTNQNCFEPKNEDWKNIKNTETTSPKPEKENSESDNEYMTETTQNLEKESNDI